MGSYLSYKDYLFFSILSYKNILFFFLIVLGIIITVRSSTWFICWVGLEINLLSFIPIILRESVEGSDCSIKYYLVQSLRSIILLIGILLENLNFIKSLEARRIFLRLILITTLGIKLGIPPFHYWFPEVSFRIRWLSNIILLTIQKLGPFILLSYIINNVYTIVFIGIILLRIVVGGLGGLNQVSLRKIIVYSSINHIGWIIMALWISPNLWATYYLIYVLLRLGILFTFFYYDLNYFLEVYNLDINKGIKFLIFVNLLSLGGIPPFLGFYPKWLVIERSLGIGLGFIIFLIVILTIISLYFYLRLIYTRIIFDHNFNYNINIFSKKPTLTLNSFILSFRILNLFGLIIMVFN